MPTCFFYSGWKKKLKSCSYFFHNYLIFMVITERLTIYHLLKAYYVVIAK